MNSFIAFSFVFLVSISLTNAKPKPSEENGNNCVCMDTFELLPVCASDGKSYPNKRFLNCQNKCKKSNLRVEYEGECLQDRVERKVDGGCFCPNTLEYLPVCASNKRTYPNRGSVRCENRCKRLSLNILHDGKCDESSDAVEKIYVVS